MIFPINKKHTFFSKEKTLLTFFFILFISFSAFGQQDKKLILLQTSDVHSRLEPINQEGDRNYDKGGFVRRATFVKEFRKEHPDMLLFDCGDISQGTPYYNMFQNLILIWIIWPVYSGWLIFRWFALIMM
jgi:5'-nucleotidase